MHEDSIVQDTTLIFLRDEVHATADKTLGADEAKHVVTFKDGTRLEKHVEHADGSTEIPLNDAMLETKFKDQFVAILGDGLEA